MTHAAHTNVYTAQLDIMHVHKIMGKHWDNVENWGNLEHWGNLDTGVTWTLG